MNTALGKIIIGVCVALGAVLFFARHIRTQSPTPNFAFNETSTYPTRATGIDSYDCNSYNLITGKNLLSCNDGGFQAQEYNPVEQVQSGTTTGFTSAYIYGNEAANFTVGWTFVVAAHGATGTSYTGGAQGCTGTIASQTAAVRGTNGPTYTFSAPCTAALSNTDTVYLRSPANRTSNYTELSSNWQVTGSSGSTCNVDTTSALLPPAILGLPQPPQYLQCTLAASGYVTVTTFVDYLGGAACNNYLVSGNYTMGIQASLQSGSASLAMNMVREVSGGQNPVNGTVALSGSAWAPYSVNSSTPGTEVAANACVAANVGEIAVSYELTNTGSSAASVGLIGAYDNELSDTNTSPFRDVFINKVRYENAGELRFNSINIGIASLNDLLTPQAYRKPASAQLNNIGAPQQGTPAGIFERLQACQAAGVQRCSMTIPTTWPATDYQNLSDYLFGSTATTYGALRAALGQAAPWSTVFSEIILEIGNETWNSGFPGQAYIPIQNYIPLATNICQALKSAASWNAVGQCAASAQQVQGVTFNSLFTAYDTAHVIDLLTSSNYSLEGALSTCTQPSLYQYEAAETFLNTTLAGNDVHDLLAATGPKIAHYESGEAPYGTTSCTQAQINAWIATEGTGLTETIAPALEMSAFPGRMTHYNRWVMTQDNFTISATPASFTANIWGDWRQLDGPAANPRPQAVAISAVNSCFALGTGYTVTATNVPTMSLAAGNNLPAASNVPLLVTRKYGSGSNRCIVVWNLDPTTSYSFTWSGINVPTGGVSKTLYSSAHVADNNEPFNASASVALASSVLSSPGGDSLPANSFAVYTYSTAAASNAPSTLNHQVYGSASKYGGIQSY